MAKLNQIIAIEKGIKSRVYGDVSGLFKAVQKEELFNGFERRYNPKEEDGEQLPAERKHVQFNVRDVLRDVVKKSEEIMDVTARKEWSNCVARADISVTGTTVLTGVPVTYLLFLEKQLNDLRSFVAELPVLDPGEQWTPDPNSGLYRTEVLQTNRSRKAQRPLVLYQATPEHPAQTQVITEDVPAGTWNHTKFSGAIPKPLKDKLAERVEALLQAVKQAREEANGIDEVEAPKAASAVFGYLMEGITG